MTAANKTIKMHAQQVQHPLHLRSKQSARYSSVDWAAVKPDQLPWWTKTCANKLQAMSESKRPGGPAQQAR